MTEKEMIKELIDLPIPDVTYTGINVNVLISAMHEVKRIAKALYKEDSRKEFMESGMPLEMYKTCHTLNALVECAFLTAKKK